MRLAGQGAVVAMTASARVLGPSPWYGLLAASMAGLAATSPERRRAAVVSGAPAVLAAISSGATARRIRARVLIGAGCSAAVAVVLRIADFPAWLEPASMASVVVAVALAGCTASDAVRRRQPMTAMPVL